MRVIPTFHHFFQSQSDGERSGFLDTLKHFSDSIDEDVSFFFGKRPSLVTGGFFNGAMGGTHVGL